MAGRARDTGGAAGCWGRGHTGRTGPSQLMLAGVLAAEVAGQAYDNATCRGGYIHMYLHAWRFELKAASYKHVFHYCYTAATTAVHVSA